MSDALLSVEAAQTTVLAGVEALAETEMMAPDDALGRVVAGALVATTSIPPWDCSAMDGYAIRASDLRSATNARPVRLTVVGEVRAGRDPDVRVLSDTAVRIATGARIPSGANAVVPVESTTPMGESGSPGPRGREATGPLPVACLVHERVPIGWAIRRAGSSVAAGTEVVRVGETVTPAAVALAAGIGAGSIVVRRRPVVAVLAVGDEIRGVGTETGSAGIPDANGPGLRALARDAGAVAMDIGIAEDRLEDVVERLRRGIAEADLVVVSGGASEGPYDVVRNAFDAVGHMNLWRVSIQPGKPFAFGRADAEGRESPVLLFGLPGNPVASWVTFELFVRPAIRRLAGHSSLHRAVDRGVLEEPVTKIPGRRGYQLVVALRDDSGTPLRDTSGRVRVRLAGGRGSRGLTALTATDALAVIPEASALAEAGTEVELRWLGR